MDTVKIRVYYDFASTLCYVAHRVLSEVHEEIEELGVELQWQPIDLTMAAPWDRGDSFTDEVREAVRNTALALGIDVVMPDPWLDSRPVSHVALQLSTPAQERRWRSAVYRTFFDLETPRLTSDLRLLAEELAGAAVLDLDGDEFPAVQSTTEEAFALGITGVPTLLLDNWMFGGVYDGPSMVQVMQKLAEQYRELGHSAVN